MVFKTVGLAIGALSVMTSGVMAENDDPIVFVHGYGGSSDHFQYGEELSQGGLPSFAVNVNPEAANHIRACELYAQIKGQLTDFGACYSRENFISRYGTDYTGKALYPEWDEDHQLHFIGHSQGGLTVRYLERMLEQGSDCAEDTWEFFTGGKRWITSLTAMATPQEGSSVFDPDFGPGWPETKYMLPKAHLKLQTSFNDNLDFSYANLPRRVSESTDDYFTRVEASGLFEREISGIFDMSTKGVEKFSMQNDPSPYPDRYYFGIATERTNPEHACFFYGVIYMCDDIEVPDPLMNDYYQATAAYIGKYAADADKENDGIVSNSRARCPRYTECDEVPDGTLDWYPGKWQFIDLDFVDHMQLVLRDDANDASNFQNSAKRIWMEHGVRLKGIPSKSIPKTAAERTASSEKAAEVRRYLDAHKFLVDFQVQEERGTSTGGVVTLYIFIVLVVGVIGVAAYRRVKAKRNNNQEVNHYSATL